MVLLYFHLGLGDIKCSQEMFLAKQNLSSKMVLHWGKKERIEGECGWEMCDVRSCWRQCIWNKGCNDKYFEGIICMMSIRPVARSDSWGGLASTHHLSFLVKQQRFLPWKQSCGAIPASWFVLQQGFILLKWRSSASKVSRRGTKLCMRTSS